MSEAEIKLLIKEEVENAVSGIEEDVVALLCDSREFSLKIKLILALLGSLFIGLFGTIFKGGV